MGNKFYQLQMCILIVCCGGKQWTGEAKCVLIVSLERYKIPPGLKKKKDGLIGSQAVAQT